MFLTTSALVLREVKYKERDKILTIMTPADGKLTVTARGARSRGSKLAASTQFLCFSEMTLFGNKGRWHLNEADVKEQFLGLRDDIAVLALATYFSELLDAVADEDSPNPALFSLGLNTLFALSEKKYSPEHIKASAEIRLMCISGYEPSSEACGVCGNSNISAPVLSLSGGVVRCRGCKGPGQADDFPLTADSLKALRYISSADAKKVFSYSLSDEDLRTLGGAAEKYINHQLERGFRALEYWKTIK